MNSIDDLKGGNTCMPDVSGHEGVKIMKSTLRGLDKIGETIQDSLTNFNKGIFDIYRELDAATQELSLMESHMCSRLNLDTNLKRSVLTNSSLMDGQISPIGHLSSSLNLPQETCYEDELSSSDVLRKIEEKVYLLGNTTNESLASALEKLRVVKENSKRHTRELNVLRNKVEKQLKELRDLVKN